MSRGSPGVRSEPGELGIRGLETVPHDASSSRTLGLSMKAPRASLSAALEVSTTSRAPRCPTTSVTSPTNFGGPRAAGFR